MWASVGLSSYFENEDRKGKMDKSERKFIKRLKESERPIVTDGAMGTLLHARGIPFDDCFDALNMTQPAIVADIHRDYIQAGVEVIKTNTFGANRIKLDRHGLEDRVAEINIAAVNLAQKVVMASFKEVMIAGDIGPLGVPLAPFGRIQQDEAFDIYKEQAQALIDAGVDLILIETMVDIYAVKGGRGSRSRHYPLPCRSLRPRFTRDLRT